MPSAISANSCLKILPDCSISWASNPLTASEENVFIQVDRSLRAQRIGRSYKQNCIMFGLCFWIMTEPFHQHLIVVVFMLLDIMRPDAMMWNHGFIHLVATQIMKGYKNESYHPRRIAVSSAPYPHEDKRRITFKSKSKMMHCLGLERMWICKQYPETSAITSFLMSTRRLCGIVLSGEWDNQHEFG